MNREPSVYYVTVRAIQPVIAGFKVLNISVDHLLQQVGINPRHLVHPDGRIPHAAMMAFWEAAVQATRDPDIGLHVAEAVPLEAYGIHTYALQSSPTLRDALQRACRYQRLIHGSAQLTFKEEVSVGMLRHQLPNGRAVPRQTAEYLVTTWIRMCQLVIGSEWSPHRVLLAHPPPPDIREHQRIFGSAIDFQSGQTALHLPRSLLHQSNVKADQGLIYLLDEYAAQLMQKPAGGTTLREHVHQLLRAALADGTPTAQDIASRLHISVRTLHRNMKKEGTSFKSILDELRHREALRYLADPQISIAEVGFLLGYAELSPFYRAFKRWSGQTPAQYRATLTHFPSPRG